MTDLSAIMCIPNETKVLFEKKNEGCSQAENLLAEINLGCVIANKNKKLEAYLAILQYWVHYYSIPHSR